MKRMVVGILGAMAMAAVGCAGIERPKATALDGQVYRVAVASDRGGAPEMIEMKFANGDFEASDAQREGSVPAPYVVRTGETAATSFEAETRAPGAVRRIRGRVDGVRIEGALDLARDGVPPVRYTFRGEAI